MDQPTHLAQATHIALTTHLAQDQMYVMPWHFRAEDTEHGRDCVLIATMLGDEMQAISLHAGHLPDASPSIT